MSSSPTTIVWLRDDLRVRDNPALHEAVRRGDPIVVLYVLDDESSGIRPLGAASRWWLHHSLEALAAELGEVGLALTLRRGPAEAVVHAAVSETEATAVLWNRRYGEAERTVDTALKSSLREAGLEVESFQGSLLAEPWTVLTGQGGWYKVFTPFYRAVLAKPAPRAPLPAPTAEDGLQGRRLDSDELASWGLLPTAPDWAGGIRERWRPGSAGAHERLSAFLRSGIDDYPDEQDLPAEDGTSGLSPHLRFGEVSPFELWQAVDRHRARRGAGSGAAAGSSAFLRQLVWREFAYHLLFHLPSITTENMRPEFDRFPWQSLPDSELERWKKGRTGIPLVDAGMRELWQTGVMHNRVRMVTASFLVKNLRVDWRVGEAWFWDTLVDADPASNALNWQWVAGSGPDAAPYFRVFNPELQASKFDAAGQYVARYVPELGTEAYPAPMVDLKASRAAALDAYATIR
ncbi:DNA photolyase family protein [Herbiconiux sp. CPCC 203407]|uniref:DNA photolyase family protein n=1 Tax=Herbiconiux oxytropis TaxID=2970915 RepID=A0AA41XK30_9MICO|nr:deoxyribodipyrimidine photo-lyase [Herbiconiux oxytropis]MCS5722761.1 DNA photolyase family protein [Herbiconiux oxytropis]MCS5727031.1 DNA photolyase family protein [Herbiconiux oxytropis]